MFFFIMHKCTFWLDPESERAPCLLLSCFFGAKFGAKNSIEFKGYCIIKGPNRQLEPFDKKSHYCCWLWWYIWILWWWFDDDMRIHNDMGMMIYDDIYMTMMIWWWYDDDIKITIITNSETMISCFSSFDGIMMCCNHACIRAWEGYHRHLFFKFDWMLLNRRPHMHYCITSYEMLPHWYRNKYVPTMLIIHLPFSTDLSEKKKESQWNDRIMLVVGDISHPNSIRTYLQTHKASQKGAEFYNNDASTTPYTIK
jgi:hypothetical protein